MNKKLVLTLLALVIINCVNGKRSLSGRGGSSSARGTSRRTSYNPHPAPTSLSYPQPSAQKPALSGWQEKTGSKQSKPQNSQTGSHSYPSSQTGLSGNKQTKPSTNQESVQKSSATQNLNGQQPATGLQTNSQSGHSYPASNGLSGSPGSGYPQQTGSGVSHQQGSGYPQQPGSGLSGSGVPPSYSGAAAPPPYSGYKPANGATYQGNNNNYGNNYQHPQPPPPYSNYGSNHGGGHPSYHPNNGPQMPGYGSQSPGYFGNYANGNRGGMSRSGSALTGVGIAGAGVGTLLTGLALWNLARSTGNRHHTVVYDNRGQPVAVAPENNNQSEANSMLADLVNCSLIVSNDEKTDVLAIPCAIATSFTPDAEVKTSDTNINATDNTKCTVSVINKSGKEFMTTIPCSILLSSAAENNVTEPVINENDSANGTVTVADPTPIPIQPSALILASSNEDQSNATVNVDCAPPAPGEIRDPINPCFSVTHNLTVIPLPTTEPNENHDKN